MRRRAFRILRSEAKTLIRSLCVFCGSAAGRDPRHVQAAREVGALLAARGIVLVYGGASVGLMGAVADAALAAGGQVVGILPRMLSRREIAHSALTEFIEVETLAERKALMAERSDAFLVLPGGIGTLDELFEMWSWTLLGLHEKPCWVLNVGGYYDGLRDLVRRGLEEGFIRQAPVRHIEFMEDLGELGRKLSESLTLDSGRRGR